MITMTEIAKLTGVSQPTVSRVLNGNLSVNPEVRERVLACAKEHGFQPNIIAQSLVGNKTHLIGVLLTDISNPFFADLAKYLEQEARNAGYSLILFSSNYNPEDEQKCLEVVQRYRVDGLIAVPVDEHSAQWKSSISRLDIPTVVMTRYAEGLDSFYIDHAEAGAQVGRYLYKAGYRRYLFYGTTKDTKYQGFAEALTALDPEFSEHLTVIAEKDDEIVRRAAARHFVNTKEPTGIFAYNDRRAVQLMGILQHMGVRIPEQAGIVGFDNIYLCEYLHPRLTSVAQPNEQMARLAMSRLLQRIEQPDEQTAENHPLQARIEVRESVVQQNMNEIIWNRH